MPPPDRNEPPNTSLSPMGLAFVLVWCTGYLAGKMAVAHGAALTTLVWRFGLAALVFLGLAACARVPWGPRQAIGHSAVVGILSLALQFAGVYLGLRWGASAGMAALVIGTMPLAVAFIAVAAGSERLCRRQWSGFVLGFGGVLLVVADRVDGVATWPAWAALVLGLVGISAGTLYQKRFASTIDLRVGLAVQNIAATVVLLPFAVLLEQFHHERSLDYFLPVLWMVLVNSVGGFALLFVLIRRGAASAVAALFFLMPPVTAVLGQFVLGEHLTALKLCGFAGAAIGVWLATRAPQPTRDEHP